MAQPLIANDLSATYPARRRPRVGHINFMNCLPLLWGLARTGSLIDLDLTRDAPDGLNNALTTGHLDISPISLVEFLRHADDLVALPRIAIGCDGPVMSCLIVSKVPLNQLDGERVALGSVSRTSVMLARLLFSEVVGIEPSYIVCPQDLELMMSQARAAVVIGDVALRALLYDAPARGLDVYDLGQMWHDLTGMPFVFALFAVRKDYLASEPAVVRAVHTGLLASRDLALAEVHEVCEHACRWEPFEPEALKQYYTTALDFGLSDRHLRGIKEFARRAGAGPSGFAPDVRFPILQLLQFNRRPT